MQSIACLFVNPCAVIPRLRCVRTVIAFIVLHLFVVFLASDLIMDFVFRVVSPDEVSSVDVKRCEVKRSIF